MLPSSTPLTALETRVTREGARPLFTWYQPSSGARIELSATTFANWVDKACNLCGTLGVDDEPVVGLSVLHDHPGHWLSWVWVFAAWQAGGRVVVATRGDLGMVDLAVIGPDDPRPVPGAETVACSLHPLGLGFPEPTPGVTDAQEILSEPDVHQPGSPERSGVWWTVENHDSTGQDMTGDDLAALPPLDSRVLLRASSAESVLTAFVGVLLGGGSLVVVDGPVDDDQLAAIAASERVDAG